eukprot:gb/GEZN01001179.1/.p1 GENE.gb/GEZN01001179.1/~~gb/GEZN01001179.1/.p1  ORF type:complete len:897 (+),score=182.94 gb/GEZN01001179.1/:117-2807(+)
MKRQEMVSRIQGSMDRPEYIRNISVIAHVDAGKSTLTDSLIAGAGLMSRSASGEKRFMDTRPDEAARGITIKSTSVSMIFEMPEWKPTVLPKKGEWKPPTETKGKAKGKSGKAAGKKLEGDREASSSTASTVPHLLNLIDCPGHVDFSSEVSAALRLTDGAVVVLDAVEGVCVQTRTVLRQALKERVKPVLFINKLDRLLTELELNPEEAYARLMDCLSTFNSCVSEQPDEVMGDLTVWPQQGTVGFGAGLMGWGFTLPQLARLYNRQFGLSEKKMSKKLWGDHFWDASKQRWQTSPTTRSGRVLKRGFCLLVWEPLQTLFKAGAAAGQEGSAAKEGRAVLDKFLLKQGLALSSEERALPSKKLLKTILQAWIPADRALTQLIVQHLPSPDRAQAYRVLNLYSGPQDDEVAAAVRACRADGPLVVFVSKMVPTQDKSRFFAFGRVFSGTIKTGQRVRVQRPGYAPGEEKSSCLSVCSVQGAVLMMGPFTEQVGVFPAGTLVGIVGLDQHLLKSGTISDHPNAHNIADLQLAVAPIVRVAIKTTRAADRGKLKAALLRLAKSDPLVLTYVDASSGENIVAGAGELHLSVCLQDLQSDFAGESCPLTVSQPVVSYRESVSKQGAVGIGKSANKHNRVFVEASPLLDKLTVALEAQDDAGSQKQELLKKHGWDSRDAKKVMGWGLGPDMQGNVLMNRSAGVAHLEETGDAIVRAFHATTQCGPLSNEPMRGVLFGLTDGKFHRDSAHRGAMQVTPAAQRALSAALLQARPVLHEPIYRMEITAPNQLLAKVYPLLRARRATLDLNQEDEEAAGKRGALGRLVAFLPVAESFGFSGDLKGVTSGEAFAQAGFSHWSTVPGDVFESGSLANTVLAAIRKRKGLPEELPKLADFHASELASN